MLRTHIRKVGQSVVRTDMKTVYPPTNTVCGGYNYIVIGPLVAEIFMFESVNGRRLNSHPKLTL